MDEGEDTYCRFGTPLDPLDEDEVPSKKPIAIEDQIVTDENGKRRFHGAFTGGFSAGFWNTVGSLEGWKPQTFKSSRNEKAGQLSQRVIDFMDDEDLGEFGIAPQRVQTTEDFTRQDASAGSSTEKTRKRKFQQGAGGPIPGVPVLHQLLQPAKENIAVRLLKKMGWKEGQGVGARQTRKEKKLAAQRNARERYIMKKYGCDVGPNQKDVEEDEDEESDLSDDEITFAPDDFEPFVCSIKMNTFGIGYEGLSRDPVLKKQQHINLFGNAFEVVGKNNKKLSIRGQAFGVGALEEEDEDIYEKDDMTRYDFTLGGDPKKLKSKTKDTGKNDQGFLDGFMLAENASIYLKKIFTITIAAEFKPRNWAARKSRFEPLDQERAAVLRKENEYRGKGLGRHDLDPDQRGKILGEASTSSATASIDDKKDSEPVKPKKTYLERINEKYRGKDKLTGGSSFMEKLASNINFTKGEVLNEENSTTSQLEGKPTSQLEDDTRKENEKIMSDAKNITKSLDKTPGVFKPFALSDDKQNRYDQYLEKNLRTEDETLKFLATIQPLSMSDWDREMEMKEFIQARSIYRPLKGMMSDRFVSESTIVADRVENVISKQGEKTIKIERTKTMWKPCSQLCKRFNIAEPFGGALPDDKKQRKKPRFSVFDYLEMSVNTKDNFVTPVIIPTKVEKPKPIVSQTDVEKDKTTIDITTPNSSRLSTKELFNNEIKTSKIEWGRVTEGSVDSIGSKTTTVEKAKKTTFLNRHKTPLERKVEEMKNKHPSEKKDLFKAIFDDTDSEGEETDQKLDAAKQDGNQPLDAVKILGIDAHKDIFAASKQSAGEINILRNTSPPRGIFANLFAKKPIQPVVEEVNKQPEVKDSEKIAPKNSEEELGTSKKSNGDRKIIFKPRSERNPPPVDLGDVYGPQVPMQVALISAPTTSETLVCPAKPDDRNVLAKTSVNPAKPDDSNVLDAKLLKLLTKSKKIGGKIVEEWVEKPHDDGDDGDRKKKKDRVKDRDKKKKSKKHKKDKKHKKNK